MNGKMFFLLALVFFGIDASAGVPAGFYVQNSGSGVITYRKDYSGGQPDYVTVVDLAAGADLVMLQGNVINAGTGAGYYGGDNPSFQRRSQTTIWSSLNNGYADAYAMVNGQFFSQSSATKAPLAFPVKENGVLVSDGYGGNEYPDSDLILEIFANSARISQLSETTLHNSTASTLIAGLTTYQCLKGCGYTGRTFMGVGGTQNSDGTYSKVYIFSSISAREDGAASVLAAFGAVAGIMLDGGGSSMLTVKGTRLVTTSRTVPQAIGVLEAP